MYIIEVFNAGEGAKKHQVNDTSKDREWKENYIHIQSTLYPDWTAVINNGKQRFALPFGFATKSDAKKAAAAVINHPDVNTLFD